MLQSSYGLRLCSLIRRRRIRSPWVRCAPFLQPRITPFQFAVTTMVSTAMTPDDAQLWIDALCPLTLMPFIDPVKAADGITYEREPLKTWMRNCGKRVSPLTGAAMASSIVPDPAATSSLAQLLSKPIYKGLKGAGLAVVHSALFDDLDKIDQDLVADLGLRPPSIVCLGNESSGKSTLLERLIGFPVLPRDKDLCTRMIIRLQLRRGPYIPFKVSVVARSNQQVFSTEHVAAANLTAVVQRVMNAEVARARTALVTDRELTVHLQLPHLCNMNIVDLPGLVTTGSLGVDMPRLTRELAESVIDEEGLSATYLLLVEASMNANQSIAATLIVEKKLQNRCLGVLTKLDLLAPASDDESVVQLVAAKLLVTSPGSVPLEPVGWLGCASRAPPRVTLEKVEVGRDVWRLHNTNMGELQLLEKWSSDADYPLPPRALSRLGMGEVRKRVEEYFEQHLVVHWVPQLLALLKQAVLEETHTNVLLGWPMPPDPRYQSLVTALSVAASNVRVGWPVPPDPRQQPVATALSAAALPVRYGSRRTYMPLHQSFAPVPPAEPPLWPAHDVIWTPASIAELRSVLALRVDATLNLESHDWMFLTSCQPIIEAVAKLRARTTTWSSQGSLTVAEAHRTAKIERLAWGGLVETLVAELHDLSLTLPELVCEAIFTDPDTPTPNSPTSDASVEVALGQENEPQQAAMTRLGRFDQLRDKIEAQLMSGVKNSSQAFLSKAREHVATTDSAVLLTYDLTVGPAVPRCKMTCDERAARIGDLLMTTWFETVVEPFSAHLQRIVAEAECFEESCSEDRIDCLHQVVNLTEVMARFIALRHQYDEKSPLPAAAAAPTHTDSEEYYGRMMNW
jgi:GTPase SAR1 family protein